MRKIASFPLAVPIVLAVAAARIAYAQAPTPDADRLLGAGRVGPLRAGMTADEVVAVYGAMHVKAVDLRLEGAPSPALEIRLENSGPSSVSLIAELFPSGDRIFRVRVYDPNFRTAEGLGVGSTLAQIRAAFTVRMAVGEGNVVAVAPAERQLSFDFGTRWFPSVDLPDSARVQSVLAVWPSRVDSPK